MIKEKDELIENMRCQIMAHQYQIHQLFNEREGLWMKVEDLAGTGFEKRKQQESIIADLKEMAENANQELASATEDLQFAQQDN